jgi:hypothetical protein
MVVAERDTRRLTCLDGLKEFMNTSKKIADLLGNICTEDFQNTKQDC